MPRDKGGFGRTGKKHFKVAKFNNRRPLKDLGQPTSLMLTGQAAAAPLNDASATVEERVQRKFRMCTPPLQNVQ